MLLFDNKACTEQKSLDYLAHVFGVFQTTMFKIQQYNFIQIRNIVHLSRKKMAITK